MPPAGPVTPRMISQGTLGSNRGGCRGAPHRLRVAAAVVLGFLRGPRRFPGTFFAQCQQKRAWEGGRAVCPPFRVPASGSSPLPGDRLPARSGAAAPWVTVTFRLAQLRGLPRRRRRWRFWLGSRSGAGWGRWGPLLHLERGPCGMKANSLGTAENVGHGHPALCPRGGFKPVPPHPGLPPGLPSPVSSSRLGDTLGGSSVLDEALIIELIGAGELRSRVPHAQPGWRRGAGSRPTPASTGQRG